MRRSCGEPSVDSISWFQRAEKSTLLFKGGILAIELPLADIGSALSLDSATRKLSDKSIMFPRSTRQSILAGLCFLLALFFFCQFLGLLTIQRIVDRQVRGAPVAIPLSVRFVGMVADRLHEDVLRQPLNANGSNWPAGFRAFFFVEMCGLAGMSFAFFQMGMGHIRLQRDWRRSGQGFFIASLLLLVVGLGCLKVIRPRQDVPYPPTEMYDLPTNEQSTTAILGMTATRIE